MDLPRVTRVPALALGVLLFVGCLFSYPRLLKSFTRPVFVVDLQADDVHASAGLRFETASKAPLFVDGTPYDAGGTVTSGLHHLRWQRSYAGGHERSVGHTQLVGPLQDPANPPCSTHLLISQSFLDDGKASPGTMAHLVKTMINTELTGISIWPLGTFREVKELTMSWTRVAEGGNPFGLHALLKEEGNNLSGYLRVELTLLFSSGKVPLQLSIIPRVADSKLDFKLIVNARLKLQNRFYQMIVKLFDGNDRVSRIIDRDLQGGLRYILDSPPNIPLGNGSQLEVSFCKDQQLLFHGRGFVAVPLAIGIASHAPYPPLADTSSLPIDHELEAPLAIDIDRNGLNAIIHKLWSSELLDQQVAAQLARSFNEQESVQNLLSLRIASARFHLPPTIELNRDSISVRAALRTRLLDGEQVSEAALFTQITWPLSTWQAGEELSLHLDDVQMSCTPKPGRLQACYSQILDQVRANQEPLQSGLAQSFSDLLSELLMRRSIQDSSVDASFALESTRFIRHDAVLRAELFGQLQETQP